MGKANSLFGDGILRFERAKTKRSDQFFYDPMFPVPTLGGGFSHDAANIGSFDQRPVEVRQDVLVYTSEPLSEPLRVSGFIKAELYLSSNVPDTDITLKLIDVYPDGRAYNLDDTIFRLRYREGYDKNVPMQEEEIYKVIIPPMITANTFNLGHRIRLEISSSNFPRYGRNLNTGGSNFNESKPVIASTKIHHSPITPSRLVLPIAPN